MLQSCHCLHSYRGLALHGLTLMLHRCVLLYCIPHYNVSSTFHVLQLCHTVASGNEPHHTKFLDSRMYASSSSSVSNSWHGTTLACSQREVPTSDYYSSCATAFNILTLLLLTLLPYIHTVVIALRTSYRGLSLQHHHGTRDMSVLLSCDDSS
jgi:hypothetical protein